MRTLFTAQSIFLPFNVVVAITLGLPSDLLGAERSFQCRWIAGDSGRERAVDVVIIDLEKQQLDLLITKNRDGWTYSNRKNEKVWEGQDTIDLRWRSPGVITATAFRADIPTIVTLDEQTGRLSWIYVSGIHVRRYDYVCGQRVQQ